MSTLARWDDARAVLRLVDPVLLTGLLESWERLVPCSAEPLELAGHVVLVGHRAAGKSSLLPRVAALLHRGAVDLDAEIARAAGEPISAMFRRGEAHFRAQERAAFLRVPAGSVIAAGGGFLSHHADLLAGHLPVLVPVSLETYRRRLTPSGRGPVSRSSMTRRPAAAPPSEPVAPASGPVPTPTSLHAARPRLRPFMSLEEELTTVFTERESIHARIPTMPLLEFLARAGSMP